MLSEVILRPETEIDIAQAASWYESQQPGLGFQFVEEIKCAFKRIAQNPSLYSTLHKEVRRALIHKFPFGIYYFAEEKKIVIIAVMHVSRNPQRWQQRTS